MGRSLLSIIALSNLRKGCSAIVTSFSASLRANLIENLHKRFATWFWETIYPLAHRAEQNIGCWRWFRHVCWSIHSLDSVDFLTGIWLHDFASPHSVDIHYRRRSRRIHKRRNSCPRPNAFSRVHTVSPHDTSGFPRTWKTWKTPGNLSTLKTPGILRYDKSIYAGFETVTAVLHTSWLMSQRDEWWMSLMNVFLFYIFRLWTMTECTWKILKLNWKTPEFIFFQKSGNPVLCLASVTFFLLDGVCGTFWTLRIFKNIIKNTLL